MCYAQQQQQLQQLVQSQQQASDIAIAALACTPVGMYTYVALQVFVMLDCEELHANHLICAALHIRSKH